MVFLVVFRCLFERLDGMSSFLKLCPKGPRPLQPLTSCLSHPTPGVLYNQFLSQVDFELLLAHARELGVLVFENSAKRLMVVTPAGHSDVKRFWKRQKHSS